MKRDILTLHIMMGLPASGKTTFAKKLHEKYGTSSYLICMDDDNTTYCGNKRSIKRLKHDCYSVSLSKEHLIVDGLVLTNEDLLNVIQAVANCFADIEVIVYHWNEDRETCIWNDGNRRDTPSYITITKAQYDSVVNKEEINKNLRKDVKIIKVVEKIVERKTKKEVFISQVSNRDKNDRLCSVKWCTGGAYGNCWDNTMYPVSAEDPVDFVEFNELLESICPDISFLKYLKLKKECVSIDSEYKSDYYGGGCGYSWYICDLNKLYDILEEMHEI